MPRQSIINANHCEVKLRLIKTIVIHIMWDLFVFFVALTYAVKWFKRLDNELAPPSSELFTMAAIVFLPGLCFKAHLLSGGARRRMPTPKYKAEYMGSLYL